MNGGAAGGGGGRGASELLRMGTMKVESGKTRTKEGSCEEKEDGRKGTGENLKENRKLNVGNRAGGYEVERRRD